MEIQKGHTGVQIFVADGPETRAVQPHGGSTNPTNVFHLSQVTSVSCERTISSLKRIKTRLRHRISDERLSSICVFEIENDIAHKLNRENLVDIFAGPPDKPKKPCTRSFLIFTSLANW
eukprot:sb/3476312/